MPPSLTWVHAAVLTVFTHAVLSRPARPAHTLVTHTLAVVWPAAQLALVSITQEVGALTEGASDNLKAVRWG